MTNPKTEQRPAFVPLNAPHVDAEGAPTKSVAPSRPSAPVDWFRKLAPELTALRSAPTLPAAMAPLSRDSKARNAQFRDVDQIVQEERERRMIGEPEPPEITKLRYEAEQTARELVGEAYTRAQSIEDEARQQGIQAGFEQGYADGKAQGEREAQAQAQVDKEAFRADIATFLAHIEGERQRTWNALEPEVIRMVFELARLVIKQEIEVSRDVSLSIVRNALRRVSDAGTVRIRVNMDDLTTLRGNREELLTLVDNLRHLEIIEDRRVSPGGCIIETESGNIDARLETQLAEAASLLDLQNT